MWKRMGSGQRDKMRIIIAGSRTFDDIDLLFQTMDELVHKQKLKQVVILSGHANGADIFGEEWAWKRGHSYEVYRPNWDKFGNAAGPIRNTEMVSKADAIVAFWDGESRGTADVLRKARKAKLKVKVVRFKVKVKKAKPKRKS
jgi:hypothetical protein